MKMYLKEANRTERSLLGTWLEDDTATEYGSLPEESLWSIFHSFLDITSSLLAKRSVGVSFKTIKETV